MITQIVKIIAAFEELGKDVQVTFARQTAGIQIDIRFDRMNRTYRTSRTVLLIDLENLHAPDGMVESMIKDMRQDAAESVQAVTTCQVG